MTDISPVQVIPEGDFDRDGTYETDLSTYFTERGGGLTISRGASVQGEPREGNLTLQLDNFDGTFTLDYTGSALHGQLEAHVPIRIRIRFNSTDYVAFTGYVTRYRPKFGRPGDNRCTLEAKDLTAHLKNYPLVNLTAATRDTGEAIEAIADALGIAAIVDSDPGMETLPLHWCRNANALSALMDVVRSEMGGELFVNADGAVRVLDRTARLGVFDVSHTWGTGTSIEPEQVDPELNDDDLITSCAVQANIVLLEDQNVEIFRFSRNAENPTPDSILLTAGVPYVVELDFGSPMTAIVEAESGVDYTLNTAIDGSGTDVSSSLTVTVTDHGAGFGLKLDTSTTGYLTYFRLRGLPANFVVDRPVFTHALSIPNSVMDQGVTLQVPFAEDTQATMDYPVAVCRTYRYPYPLVKLDFAWDSDAIATDMLSLELWDHAYFADTGAAEWLTQIAEHFYVIGIQHKFTPGQVFRTSVTLVPSHLYFDLESIVTDSFDRADATGDLGTALSGDVWAADTAMNIVSGKARASSDSAQTPYLRCGDATDQVVEVQLAAIGAGDEVGVTFRFEDENNHYRAYLDKGSDEVICERVVGGVVTEVSSPAYTVGTTAELRVMIQDTRIRVWVDRRLYIDATDAGFAPGYRCGLFARNASGTTTFDNFHGRGI